MHAKRALHTDATWEQVHGTIKSLSERICALAARWEAAQKYEGLDISCFAGDVARLLPRGYSLMRMKKHPFGFTFSKGTRIYRAVVINGTLTIHQLN